MLTQAQRRQFEEDGYLVVEDVLDPDRDIAPVLAEYSAVLDAIAVGLAQQGELRSAYADLDFEQRLVRVCEESGRNFPQHFDFSLPQRNITHATPLHAGPAVFRTLTHPRLLDLVQDLIGPEIYSNPVQHIRLKLPRRAVEAGSHNTNVTRTPWHQDNGVIMPEADEATILTVWLPLTPATVANGCLQVVPGSHLRGELEPHCPTNATVAIPEKVVPIERARPIPMRPGSALLMTQRTIHSSLDNTTDDEVRISMDLRYQPIGQPTGRPAFAPAGFVARSQAHPESVLRDPAEWSRRWFALRDQLAETAQPTFNRWDGTLAVCA